MSGIPGLGRMTPARWLGLALLLRLIAAWTNLSTNHPDEWFQTVEFGNYLAFGFLSQSGEFHVHMRNLTWPAILALPMKAAHFLSGGSIPARAYAVKLLTALADLGILWGMTQLLARERGWSERWRQAAWALFVLPWFLIPESVRPSQEHLSAIACWVALGAIAAAGGSSASAALSLAGGAAWVMTGAFRYPSGLLGAGALFGLLLKRLFSGRRSPDRPRLGWIAAGLVLGALLGGLADWVFYGRPWESFWMYFQYNVLTGLSTAHFGAQPASVYLDYFRGPFGKVLAPLGAAAIVCVPLGLAAGLLRLEIWAWALLAYLAGHLWIPHKEPRFMAPALMLVLWSGLIGARVAWGWLEDRARKWVLARTLGRFLLAALLIGNSLFLLRALWGDNWRAIGNYMELSRHLESRPETCAIVTVRRPLAALAPWKDPARVPDPPLGFFPADAHFPSSKNLEDRPLLWFARRPQCAGDSGTVLFQPYKPEGFWEEKAGCRLLPTGPLRYFPESRWPALLQRGLVSAPWYACSSRLLTLFPKQELRTVIGTRMRRLPQLPPPGVSGEEFIRIAWGDIDPKDPAYRDATFGDW